LQRKPQLSLAQSALWQSWSMRQSAPEAQGRHAPPQSTSVSSPFRVPLVQCVGAVHCPAVHVALAQSVFPVQVREAPHFVPQEPPQSTSVSVPFFTPSVHVGA